MNQTVDRREATPERWARALDRALGAGLEVFRVADTGELMVTSASQLDTLHRTDGMSCTCAAAVAGDPVCQHRAVARWMLGTLPVVVVHIDDLAPSPCPSCTAGRVEEWGVSGLIGCRPCSMCGGSGLSPIGETLPAMQPQPERIAA